MPTQELSNSDALTLLVIDDDDQVRGLCKQCLVRAGFRVIDTDNGLDALQIAANHDGVIDMLITDIEMPKMRGPEVAREFRTLWPGAKVLFISGYTDSSQADLGDGAIFLPKPFTPQRLVETVDGALARQAQAG